MRRVSRHLIAATVVLAISAGCAESNSDSGASTSAAVPAETGVEVVPTVASTTAASPTATTIGSTAAITATVPPPTEPSTSALAPSTTLALTVANDLTPLPEQPPGVPFPTTTWPLGALPPGVDKQAIDMAVSKAFGDTDAQLVRSLLIVVGGELVYERYHATDTAQTVFNSYSIAKSFTSATVGIAAGDGLIDVAGRAERPEWADPADPRHGITVEHLLHMSSGLEWLEGLREYQGLFAAPSHAAYAAERPLVAEPGALWNYSTGTTGIVAALVAERLGGGAQLDAYVHERLLEPIGATSTTLMLDGTGVWRGGVGADSTAQDFARFGLLYLRDGVWDGARILPPGWVDYSRSPSPAASAYGAQWWLSPDGDWFEARGLYGQIVRVIPSLDAVIVATSYQNGESPALVDTVHRLLTPGGD